MEYTTNSALETQLVASEIAGQFRTNGGVIALIGSLGAGKTTFTQGFAKALGINEQIISPTFVLMRQHQLPDGRGLFHLDLYRLEENSDFSQLGLEEIFSDPKNIVLIEWADKMQNKLPSKTLKINFQKLDQSIRKITTTLN
jgi:tRNA threonylcarbamoyladenosine biosynthesis protein TsaE